jgi:hypothetical protein
MAKIECVGGPYDGKELPDRGIFWRVVATVTPGENLEPWQGEGEPAQVRPGSSGTYVQRAGVYQWEPDA